MIDTRREAAHIESEFTRYQQKVGENVIWFPFDTVNSQYSGTYDEGGRAYLPGINVPIMWVDQIESPEQYLPEGRRPVQGLRFGVSAKAIYEVGLSDREATGHRVWDAGLINDTWFDDRVNDICYYNGRYYEISNYQIRGRIREDVIIGVTCTETYPEDEYTFDFPPQGVLPPPPDPEPIVFSLFSVPSDDDPFTYTFGVNDNPNHARVYYDFGDGVASVAPVVETVEHTYATSGDYSVSASCHHETCYGEVSIDAPPTIDGYGYGPYGSGPYGDPS